MYKPSLGVALDNNLTNSETVALCLVALDMGRSPRLSASFIHTKEVMMMQASTSKYTNTNTRWKKQSLLYRTCIFITFTKIGITIRSTNDDNVTRVIFMLFLTFIFFQLKHDWQYYTSVFAINYTSTLYDVSLQEPLYCRLPILGKNSQNTEVHHSSTWAWANCFFPRLRLKMIKWQL